MRARAELVDAFHQYVAVAVDATLRSRPAAWAERFVEDCWYREPVGGLHEGRSAVTAWLADQAGRFPQTHLVAFPIRWTVVDHARGQVGFACHNVMADAGDGTDRAALVWARLVYAGAGRFVAEENVFDVAAYGAMLVDWQRARAGGVAEHAGTPAVGPPPPPAIPVGNDALGSVAEALAAAGPPGLGWPDRLAVAADVVVAAQGCFRGRGPGALAALGGSDLEAWPIAPAWLVADPDQGRLLAGWRQEPAPTAGRVPAERWTLVAVDAAGTARHVELLASVAPTSASP